MSKGMFCLERGSPGFGGSVGEKAWQICHVKLVIHDLGRHTML